MNLSSKLDNAITLEGYKTRVYTKGRAVGVLAGPAGPAVIGSIFLHNLFTYNLESSKFSPLILNVVIVVIYRWHLFA
jgi:hypothetical protein